MSVLEVFDDPRVKGKVKMPVHDGLDRPRAPSQSQVGVTQESISSKVVDVNMSNRYQSKSRTFSKNDIHDHFYRDMKKANANAKAHSNRVKDIVKSCNIHPTMAEGQSPPHASKGGECREKSLRESVEGFDESTRGAGEGGISVTYPNDQDTIPANVSNTIYNTTMHSRSTPRESESGECESPKERSSLLELQELPPRSSESTEASLRKESYGSL